MFPLHKDERGSFQELAHASNIKFGQLSLLKVNPNCSRGGHYHTRKDEWFCCIRGNCVMELINILNGNKQIINLDEIKKEFVYVKPYESHMVVNRSIGECELLVIISEEYNDKDADTYRYGESK